MTVAVDERGRVVAARHRGAGRRRARHRDAVPRRGARRRTALGAGARFSLEPELGLKLGLEATRREPAHGAAPEHTLTVHATVGW